MSGENVFLPDANIWLNALNSSTPDHKVCRSWLDKVTSSGATILVNDLTECALLRIGTHPQLGFSTASAAMSFHDSMLQYPFTARAVPGEQHTQILHAFIHDIGIVGNDINDAWLAALAIECGAVLVSLDQGFSRFQNLRWFNPNS